MRARITFATHDEATLVPLAAIVRRDGKEGLFIAEPKDLKADFVPVTTGIINGELAEVTEPKVSGLVVTMGNHLLGDGSDITLPQRADLGKAPDDRDTESGEANRSGKPGDSQ